MVLSPLVANDQDLVYGSPEQLDSYVGLLELQIEALALHHRLLEGFWRKLRVYPVAWQPRSKYEYKGKEIIRQLALSYLAAAWAETPGALTYLQRFSERGA